MTKKKEVMQITKGRDPYLDMTPLAEYCLEHGWRPIKEVVTIAMPEGREMEDLQKHLRAGKILVVP